jgi:hypothetical protein
MLQCSVIPRSYSAQPFLCCYSSQPFLAIVNSAIFCYGAQLVYDFVSHSRDHVSHFATVLSYFAKLLSHSWDSVGHSMEWLTWVQARGAGARLGPGHMARSRLRAARLVGCTQPSHAGPRCARPSPTGARGCTCDCWMAQSIYWTIGSIT